MKRIALLRHLKANGCELLREGSRHSWFVCRPTGLRSAVPRHTDVNDILVLKICKDLGIPRP